MDGAERVPVPTKSACWICGMSAVCGQKLPGQRRRVRPLCQAHADAVFGARDPAWRRMDAKTQREIVEEWLRGMTLLTCNADRPVGEVFAEIAVVNDVTTESVRLTTPLPPGEAHDLTQTLRAIHHLHGREKSVHAMVTQILIGWCARARGEPAEQVLRQLALTLDDWLSGMTPPHAT
ncbi:hypothetical protein ACWEJ6_49170 [Nonomuraea sp. NPDC004702]